jgi:hypothetical protein
MLSLTPSRGRQSAILVLILAISVLAFTAWLKISPSLEADYRPEAAQLTKLWVNPTQGWETLVKLAPAGIVLFFMAPVLFLFLARDWSWQSGMAPRSAARDIFAESRHWFRPPPLI